MLKQIPASVEELIFKHNWALSASRITLDALVSCSDDRAFQIGEVWEQLRILELKWNPSIFHMVELTLRNIGVISALSEYEDTFLIEIYRRNLFNLVYEVLDA